MMLLVLAAISSRALALLYILIFGAGSMGGMVMMTALIGLPLAFSARNRGITNILQAGAAAASVAFGLFFAWQVGFEQGLFR